MLLPQFSNCFSIYCLNKLTKLTCNTLVLIHQVPRLLCNPPPPFCPSLSSVPTRCSWFLLSFLHEVVTVVVVPVLLLLFIGVVLLLLLCLLVALFIYYYSYYFCFSLTPLYSLYILSVYLCIRLLYVYIYMSTCLKTERKNLIKK